MEIVRKDQVPVSGTFLSARQISQIVSAGIMLLFFAFVAGYYWGKKNTVSELRETFDRETVADKISYSLALNTQVESNEN